MSRLLTIELSNSAFASLERRAQATAQSPADLAAQTLEQRFNIATSVTEADEQARRARFERHFGAICLRHAIGSDNEMIDADLGRVYGEDHKGG